MKYQSILKIAALLTTSMTLLAGCALSSKLNTGNPALVSSVSQPHATVYFIRPPLQRTRGVADGNVKIELDEIPLINLGVSEYTVVKLKPGKMDVILRSLTYLTTKPMPVEVWRSRRLEFLAGETYYVETRFIQEEFRGTYFQPELVKKADFSNSGLVMSPIGTLAKAMPLAIRRAPVIAP